MNLAGAQRWAADQLTAAGIDSAALDARVLLQHVLRLSPGERVMAHDRPLAAAEHRSVVAAVERRAARVPLAYIVERREFWSLDFRVGPAVLIPRPDSETVVEVAVMGLPPDRPVRVLDLGTGTGCLLCAVLSQCPAATGVGVDISPAAAAIAAANARRLGLADRTTFVVADWTAALTGTFDLIVCNPPYIRAADFASLMPEVSRHEPRLALDGGADGLAAYARVCPELPRLLAPGGRAVLEFGAGQAADVARLCAAAGLIPAPPHADLSGQHRCLAATLPADLQKKAWPWGN